METRFDKQKLSSSSLVFIIILSCVRWKEARRGERRAVIVGFLVVKRRLVGFYQSYSFLFILCSQEENLKKNKK